jgi:2-(1,2-epoxy-1,2-dihydrophenyl)acetyl-CoA isomerase
MKDVDGLCFHREGGVATAILNRPERLNAITWPMVEGLIDFIETCSRDAAVRVVVITGEGRAFSSGDDIVDGMGEIPTRHGEPGSLRTDLGLHHELVKLLLSVPKPVVAALNGRCHGAGWVIALACDFRVARADALIGDIRSSKAIFAGQSVPLVLSRLIGQSRTIDLLITGRVIDAVEGERYGIVTRVWPAETYAQELSVLIGELAEGPTQTYAAWKLSVNRSLLMELDAYTDYERRLANLVRATDDAQEGRDAFREKRPPRFRGR